MKKTTSDMPELQSINITDDNISKLKSLFTEAFHEGNIDFDVLKQLLGENVDDKDERYGLNWHGKRQARQLALTPSRGTLRPCKEESVDWDNTKNIMIEGDNLEVLKLLQKSYAGKVKLIYIDPPYNTGKDFVYPDNFQDNMKNYLEITGQTEEGTRLSTNTETSGRYHTDWLNMMYPRLKLAKNLLAENGFIFISIDENELANLKSICCEIFGEESLVGTISRVTGTPTGGGNEALVGEIDYILVFSKNNNYKLGGTEFSQKDINIYDKEDSRGKYLTRSLRRTGGEDRREDRPSMYYPVISPDGDEIFPVSPSGYESRWMCGIETYNKMLEDGMIEWAKNRNKIWHPYVKTYLDGRKKQPSNFWQNIDGNKKATREVKELFDGEKVFDYPKSTGLIERVINISNLNESDIVLDFFAGSGTTAHALMLSNMKNHTKNRFILVQLPEKLSLISKEQVISAKFCKSLSRPMNISELTKERLRRAGNKVLKDNPEWNGDVGFRVFKLDTSNIRPWEAAAETISEQIDAYVSPILEGRSKEDLLTELMLKRGIDLSVNVETRQFNRLTISCVDGGKLFTCFASQIPASSVEGLTKEIIDWHKNLKAGKDTVCYFLDDAFENNVAKTNLCAILEQHGLTNLHSL